MIVGFTKLTQKEAEIIPFCEAGELRDVVETNVEDSPNLGVSQRCKKLLRILLREANCE
jgi:hypothetical protein